MINQGRLDMLGSSSISETPEITLGNQALPNAQQEIKGPDFMHVVKNFFGEETFQVPPNATRTVYVQGIPFDATEREVSHIFRPFFGFKALRMIHRDKKNEEKVSKHLTR